MKNLLQELFREPTEEEMQAHSVLRNIVVQNELDIPEQIMTLQYFAGIEPGLIISKVNTLNTPLLESAMCYAH